jgi:penicillin-binding protein 1A
MSINRKIKDMLIAMQIERNFTKEEIMAMYLNEIYFGHGAYGVQAASNMYFNKDVRDLNLSECALLAGIPRGPYYYSPIINMKASLKRRNIILNRMHELGYITESELQNAKEEAIQLNYNNKRDVLQAPYFSTYILSELLDKYGANMVYRGGLKIYSTLDMKMQKFAEEAFNDSGYEGAIVAIEPHSGYIKAMVGGKNFEESKFNRATQAQRQPGSAFKPFIYLTAIENGFTPNYIIEDSPITFENGWSPENYEKEFRGPVTLQEAFEDSINVVGVKLLEEVGIKKTVNSAYKAGIESKLRPDLSLVLGTSEVNPLEITSAYATIANLGERVSPISIIRIEDYEGNIIEETTQKKKRMFKEESCYVLIDMMKGVIKTGTGWNAEIGRPAGGKTGTTNDFVDAWFIGFTPDLVTAVYIGNDDRKPLGNKMTGGVVAAPIWAKFMKNALNEYKKNDFIRPEEIINTLVCKQSGLLPVESCPHSVECAFIKGTEPHEFCNIHQKAIEKPALKEYPEIKKPYFEEIETIKEKTKEKTEEPQEEETLKSLIEQLKKKYNRD